MRGVRHTFTGEGRWGTKGAPVPSGSPNLIGCVVVCSQLTMPESHEAADAAEARGKAGRAYRLRKVGQLSHLSSEVI